MCRRPGHRPESFRERFCGALADDRTRCWRRSAHSGPEHLKPARRKASIERKRWLLFAFAGTPSTISRDSPRSCCRAELFAQGRNKARR